MNHKFHYDTPKQALKWLRLHEAFSPARTDPECGRLYGDLFEEAALYLRSRGAKEVQVISLGCGGGQKDAQLLRRLLEECGSDGVSYLPLDVSMALALTSRGAAMAAGVSAASIHPMVADLALAADWGSVLGPALAPSSCRVLCFFGMLPNFLQEAVLPQLADLLRPHDLLLLSANLAPGVDYADGVARVLPLYENKLTEEWLWSVLLDLGLDRADGTMRFQIRECPGRSGLLRIEAVVSFSRPCAAEYAGQVFEWGCGDEFNLFFSYRHTSGRLAMLLEPCGLEIRFSQMNASGEEGVFLCRPRSG